MSTWALPGYTPEFGEPLNGIKRTKLCTPLVFIKYS